MTPVDTTLLNDLAADLSGDVLGDDLSRAMYSTAAGVHQVLPLGVVRPRDREDIVKTLAWCRANDVPLTMRGGGTSPVDNCLGKGLVVDTSAYLGAETEIEVHDETVTAPAGAVYARLNEALARFGRVLPPDLPTGDYRTIGGAIATNACGTNGVKYGSIIDYVESLELVLADGSVVETRPLDVRKNGFKELVAGSGAEARLVRETYELLRDRRSLIRSRTPDVRVNASGYRVERALRGGVLDLGKLVTGSEGTLGVITRATLRTAVPPAVSAVLLLYFENVQLAADSIRPVLDADPCSVEWIDARALDLVRSARPDLAHFHREKMQCVLVVEFDGADNDEIIPKLMETQRLLGADGGTASEAVVANAAPDVQEARDLRRCAANVLHNLPGPRRVTPFIEDIAVPPEMVSSCIRGLGEIARKHHLDIALTGHAGQGAFCPRPLLDLKNADDVRAMREVAEEVFAMVVDMGGTISACHGDGPARTEFLRLQYGGLCDVFAEIKRLFDPDHLLNPGIKVGGERGTLVANLRYGEDYTRRTTQPKLLYRDEPRGDVIERCHGCGACRSLAEAVAMCPVFKALRTEEAAPRAKANLLRHLLSNRETLPPEDEVVAEMTRLTDLCIGCRMCSVECPSALDVAKLMIELRARRAETLGPPCDERFARMWNTWMPFLATFPRLGNAVMQHRPTRWMLRKLFGVASRRRLPRFRVRELSGRHKPTLTKVRDRVAYFTGTCADCFSPELSQCTLDVLLRNGIEVEVVSGADSGEERLRVGDVAGARRAVERNVRRLAPLVEDGFRVVFTEPRTALFFRRGILDCVDTPEARSVAAASIDLMQFLLSLHRAGRLDTRFRAVPVALGYHAPCHLRALQIGRPSLELLRLVPELPLADLGGGCCGMSGTFGLLERNYDLSMEIGRPLFEHLKNLDVRYGLTECSFCAMQLAHGSTKRVLHPIQVLHRAYGLSEQGMEAW